MGLSGTIAGLVRYNKGMMKTAPYPAPDFSLPDGMGQLRTLDEFKGSWVVLYFYPKDDTPGCTMQACSLRDARDDLIALGAQVLGVSKDDASSHEKFKTKHNLNFTLLSGTGGYVIRAYGACGKKMFGKEGILRKTFLIDPEGVVQKVYGRATSVGHGDEVVRALQKLQQREIL